VQIEDTWRDDGTFKLVESLRSYYGSRGFTLDKRIITYCAMGRQVSQAWVVLTYLLGLSRS
jgi:3-mercaptopyruvate sulfurtransferase SseA